MSKFSKFLSATSVVTVASLAFTPASAWAQDDSTASAEDEAAEGNLIIVQGTTLRDISLQDAPVAVTALSGEELDERNISTVGEVAKFVPGFASSSFSEAEPIFAVRGANNTFSQAGVSKPVGVFLDDIYISRNSGSAFELFDIEQVSILRGPQGTTFGRNVTGGAIVIRTSRPSLNRVEAKAEVGYGNYDAIDLRGLVSVPVADSAAIKLSGSYRTRDGFGRDRLSNTEQSDLDSLNLRGQFLFEPAPSLSVLLTADYSTDENGGRTVSTSSPASADDGDIRTSEHGRDQLYDREVFGLSARVDYEADFGTFSSITGYRETDSFEDFSFSPTAFNLLPSFNPFFPFQQLAVNTESPETISQELRFTSDFGGSIETVFGLYYFQENINRVAQSIRLRGATGETIRNQTFDQDVETDSFAIYGDIEFEIVPTLTLNVAGRYTWEGRDAQVDFTDALNAAASYSSPELSANFSEFTPRVAVSWEPTDQLTIYGSYSRGFTSGGFNTEEDTLAIISVPFESETVEAWEAGIKTSFADGRFNLNVAGFIQNFDDKQEGFLDNNFNFVIVNAAEAKMKGFEIEANAEIVDGLTLFGSYSYLDATYLDFTLPNGEDRSGNFLPTSPENSLSLGIDARFPMADFGEFFFNASYTWQDDYFTGSENRPTFLIDSYDLADFSVGVESNAGWKVSLWAKNVFDQDYVLIRSDFTAAGVGEVYGAPQTYGIRLGWEFQ